MALSSAEIYRLTAEQLREECSRQGLDSVGPVRLLHQRLVQQLKVAAMANKQDNENVKASVPTDLSLDAVQTEIHSVESNSHVRGSGDSNSVFVELMRQVSPLTSEEPEAILPFVARLDDIHMLGLYDDRSFVTRILPLVPGVILRFFGACLRNGRDWGQWKKDLLREFFPLLYGNN